MEEKEINEKIKKEVIVEMIIDKLFDVLEYVKINEHKSILKLDVYELNNKELIYLLSKYDNERFKQEFIMKEKIYNEENK